MGKLTQTEFRQRCKRLGWVPLGEYINSKSKVLCKCPQCGAPHPVRPNSIFTGGTKSCGCFQKKRVSELRALSLEQVQARFVARGFKAPIAYVPNSGRVKAECPLCGKQFDAIADRVFRGETKSCPGCAKKLNGQKKWKDISGQRHGLLTAVERTNQRQHQHVVWKVQCDCGRICYLTLQHFRNNKSCGCLHRREGQANPRWEGEGEISGAWWAGFLVSARRRNKGVRIDKRQAWELFLKQKGRCALTGVPLTFGRQGSDEETTASLDRMDDSNQTYELGNIWWVHKAVNKMKRQLTVERFRYLCGLVVKPVRFHAPCAACYVGQKHGNFKGCGNLSLDYWNSLKRAVEHGGGKWSVSIQLGWRKFVEQGGKCAMTGLELTFTKFVGTKAKKRFVRGTASLDAIQAKKGHTPKNVRWVYKDVNLMKWELDDKEFRRWCRLVVKHSAMTG